MTILKQMILEKGLSQNKVAQTARVPQSSMSLIANGRLIPCPAWRRRLAEVLGVSEEVLFARKTVDGVDPDENQSRNHND